MALKVNGVVETKNFPVGEVRLDHEGKGYFHTFTDDELVSLGFKKKEEVKEVNLDLNNDGKIDHKDASIASKVMNVVKKKKMRNKKQ